jgi:hypothetical protein
MVFTIRFGQSCTVLEPYRKTDVAAVAPVVWPVTVVVIDPADRAPPDYVIVWRIIGLRIIRRSVIPVISTIINTPVVSSPVISAIAVISAPVIA